MTSSVIFQQPGVVGRGRASAACRSSAGDHMHGSEAEKLQGDSAHEPANKWGIFDLTYALLWSTRQMPKGAIPELLLQNPAMLLTNSHRV
jgi:hypothetical protein